MFFFEIACDIRTLIFFFLFQTTFKKKKKNKFKKRLRQLYLAQTFCMQPQANIISLVMKASYKQIFSGGSHKIIQA